VAFRLRRDARKWFHHIHGDFQIDFDIYYLCLMAGLRSGSRQDIAAAETSELVDHFPGEYKARGRVVVALLLSRELRRLGINFAERRLVHESIQTLVDPLSPSHLSDAGMREANRYAYGGFEVLTEWFADPPLHIETFLVHYAKRIGAPSE
jgi:hypothetical protein